MAKESNKTKEALGTEEVLIGGTKLWNAKAAFYTNNTSDNLNPWYYKETDTLENDKIKNYKDLIKACRFFYSKDPLSSTTLNKLVEIGINDLVLTKKTLTDNEFRVFEALLPQLKEFAEIMALEFLLSGLVVPEISFTSVEKDWLTNHNIKKYTALTLPTMMWLRDPNTITINTSMFGDKPSYYVEVPEDLIWFITNNGVYKDSTQDKDLYDKLVIAYPAFVSQVKSGQKKVLLENKLIFRRKCQPYQAYPIPYLEPALEALKHKRNLRRMDYSIASRVISAILLFKLGSDEFPVTEDDEDTFEGLKQQLQSREGGSNKNVERVFQLFANHTLEVEWIMPNIEALISDSKYQDINQEIIFALGFPRILITGETAKTGTSDAEFAMISPVKTMETFRDRITVILNFIVSEVARLNKFSIYPDVNFRPVNLTAFKDFYVAIKDLYASGNLSRTNYADMFGINWGDEMNKKEEENKILKAKGIEVNAPMPFSPEPATIGGSTEEDNKDEPPKEEPVVKKKTTTKPKKVE